ncbi:hypothetical protein HanRHA438_Chr16g0770241 [Helianthus annuus]|nr:hypothetical protein HanRHA438_Chr16g0770241 [Helianthus annuus]
MLEESWKQFTREFRRSPHDETPVSLTPRNDGIRRRIIDHFIRFRDKRGQSI